jgi:glutamyl-tRNA reductase
MDFREGPTSLRALLKRIDDMPDSPTSRLLKEQYCEGVVRIESCSRVEWVLAAENPTWAAELLRSALLKSSGQHAPERKMHVKVSQGALHYLCRVALGLESVAEGEHAIGRQVMRAFELAHEQGRTNRTLHLCWHGVGRILQARKATGVGSSVGVQSMAVAELRQGPKDALIVVKGTGEIGRAVLAALQRDGFSNARGFSRAEAVEFERHATVAAAAVVCTGGPSPWLRLPSRTDAPLVLDLGSPNQVLDAPGWRSVALDQLLSRRGLLLGSEALATLESLADEAAEGLRAALEGAEHHHVLEAIEAEKRRFFDADVEQMLAQLPAKEARMISEAFKGFTHRLLEVTRRAGRAS